MTTNQTIDGVPRELLLPCPLCGSDKVSLAWDVYDTDRGRRTRSQIQCLGCRILTRTFKSNAEAMAYWNNRVAQPRGEPVAWMLDGSVGGSSLDFQITDLLETQNRHGGCLVPLYAEQPAPVAGVRMCDCNQGRLPCSCRP